jgi:TfoX/Sxy family transcriptional regulator of competence genes
MFLAALPDDPAVERRKMFGYDAAFVNGNLFAGMWEDGCTVKLPAEERAALLLEGAREFAPMDGRVMREFALLPADWMADADALRTRLARSFAHVRTLPAKQPKPKGPRKKPAG